jgi:hypothetical protein
MGLRCIMGHDYGEPQRTEEREESGDERVVTVREYRECSRCGHRKTISENTEIRTNDPGRSGGATEPRPGDAGTAGNAGTTEDAAEGTGRPSTGRDEPAETSTVGGGDPRATPGVDAEEGGFDAAADGPASGVDGGDVTAAEDDGVILDDDGGDREPGEWPETDGADGGPEDDRADRGEDADDAGHGDWPTPEGEDEGYDAKPSSGGPAEAVEFGGGLAPGRSTAGGGSGSRSASGTGFARADSEPAARQPPASGAVLSCPRCDHTAPSQASSLRPGDICPECKKGYLTEGEE